MGEERVENLVIGAGEAGKSIAWELAKQGRPVLVVERDALGGACPNVACLPSKNVINSARVAHLARHAQEYGVEVGEPRIDMATVRRRKREMVDGLQGIHRQKFAAPGITVLMGAARFVGDRRIEVQLRDGGTRTILAERVFLNLGTKASVPEIPGLSSAGPMTHVEALELDRSPEHLLILGGGYVGVEAAQAFRRLGSRVTIVQRGSQLLPREDGDVAEAVQALFLDDGVELVLGANTQRVEGTSGVRVRLSIRDQSGERWVEGSDLLVATGRTPNTRGIGLDLAGVNVNQRGVIEVNDRLETTASGVWAMGECAGSAQFTHVSFDDFRVVRDNLAGRPRTTRGRLIPYCVFTDPQLGRVGVSESEARRSGINYRLARLPMSAVLRARALGETRGFFKALIEADGDRVLGFTMFGPDAGEVIAVVQTAMLGGLPYTALRDAIFTHPTMAEGLNVLFANPPKTGAN